MLQLQYIRENQQEVIDRLAIKNFDASNLVTKIIELDNDRKQLQQENDDLLAKANNLAKEIGQLFKRGEGQAANALKEESSKIKTRTKELSTLQENTTKELESILLMLPNTPHSSVPKGKGEEDNMVIMQKGEIPTLHDQALPHWELAKKYDIIDFDLGSKVTGAGFPFYKGKGARLQRALINFFLDEAIKAGYTEYQTPLMVNSASAYGTGQLPDKDGQMYHATEDDLYLIPTAEVPLTNIHRDTIVAAEQLPIKNVAYSNCFRREAGSYGKDVRGLNRLHQFDKIEIVQITRPENSYAVLDEMCNYVKGLLEKLELPYHVLHLCGGDISFTSALTFDLEVFSAAQKRWLEVSSVSNFESYQSNRMKLRYKEGKGKPQLTHTLNGSALALPRIVAALLENHQTPEGIRIPKALVPYTGFEFIN